MKTSRYAFPDEDTAVRMTSSLTTGPKGDVAAIAFIGPISKWAQDPENPMAVVRIGINEAYHVDILHEVEIIPGKDPENPSMQMPECLSDIERYLIDPSTPHHEFA